MTQPVMRWPLTRVDVPGAPDPSPGLLRWPSACPAARTSQVFTDTASALAAASTSDLSASESRSEIRAFASASSGGGLAHRLGRAHLDLQLVAVKADGDPGRVGGVEQGGGDLVGRRGDGGEHGEPGGRFRGGRQRVGDPPGGVVAERGGRAQLGLDLAHVR